MFWLPAAMSLASSAWSAIQGNKAQHAANDRAAQQAAYIQQGTDLAQKAYDQWTNGEKSFLMGRIAKNRLPGLSDEGVAAKEQMLVGQNKALTTLQRMPGANASAFLAHGLESAKQLGGLTMNDRLRKAASIENDYRTIREGENQVGGTLRQSFNAQAGISGQEAERSRATAGSAWGNVAQGMMNLANSYGQYQAQNPAPKIEVPNLPNIAPVASIPQPTSAPVQMWDGTSYDFTPQAASAPMTISRG